tara:strand:- start:2103 stop:2552 length:450 start_codon:yes stop_codon:yes gene_type:complete
MKDENSVLAAAAAKGFVMRKIQRIWADQRVRLERQDSMERWKICYQLRSDSGIEGSIDLIHFGGDRSGAVRVYDLLHQRQRGSGFTRVGVGRDLVLADYGWSMDLIRDSLLSVLGGVDRRGRVGFWLESCTASGPIQELPEYFEKRRQS